MPDYSNDSWDVAKGKLESYGSEIGIFNMSTFRERATGMRSPTGYCNGVLLDWIRRVLLTKTNRGAERDKAFLTFHFDALEDARSKAEGERTPIEIAKLNRASQTYERMQQAWKSSEMEWAGKPKTLKEKEWENAVSTMDEMRNKQRLEPKRKEKQNRFANLVLMASEKQTYSEAGYWMGALFSNPNPTILVPGYCTVLGFSVDGQPGHSVVIWQRRKTKEQNDSFYFFEPNYGVFSYNVLQKQKGLKTALQYLFWRDKQTTPKYAKSTSADKQEMSYMKFGPPKLVE
jgi:hypothetical protein